MTRAAPASCRSRLARLAPYGYRRDPAIPRFPDDRPAIVFDGVCVLCSAFASFVARRDREGRFRFIAAQTELGAALFRHAGLDPVNYETNLLIADGRFFGKMDAFVEIMCRLGGMHRGMALLRHIPSGLADRIYDLVARNRYRLLGKRETCIVPDASWRDRMIE